MKTSISYSKEVYKTLSESEDLVNIVQDKIFPIVAETDTSYPYLIFKKETVPSTVTKTCIACDNVNYYFTAVAKNYFETCDILEIVRKLFEGRHDEQILDMELNSISEDYIDGAYIQTIVFTAQIAPIN